MMIELIKQILASAGINMILWAIVIGIGIWAYRNKAPNKTASPRFQSNIDTDIRVRNTRRIYARINYCPQCGQQIRDISELSGKAYERAKHSGWGNNGNDRQWGDVYCANCNYIGAPRK